MNSPLTRRLPGLIWVVAGSPGAGKSTVVQALAAIASPAPAVLDKDTLFNGFVTAMLTAHGREHGEREGVWYDEHIKLHEYGAMAAAARQIRANGCPVILDAPFTSQIRDQQTWAQFVESLGGGEVRLVWLRTDVATLHRRLVARGNPRDAGKLARFPEFLAAIQPDRAPSVPHTVIDNRDSGPNLIEQIHRLVADAAH